MHSSLFRYCSAMRALLIVFLIPFLCSCSSGSSSNQRVPRRAPVVRFVMMDGSALSSYQLRGKTTVIAFWASWCSRSKGVMKGLDALAVKYSGRHDVVFIAASVDKEKDLEKLQTGIRYLNLDHMKHAFSGNAEYDEAFLTLGGDDVPHLFVIDRTGMLVMVGRDDSDVEEALAKLHGKIR